MKFALYGMPCSGKTTLLREIAGSLRIVNGSSWLKEQAGGSFSSLQEDQKQDLRIRYTRFLNSLSDKNLISDGHYAFEDTVVFTQADGETYDVFLYLYCDPRILWRRMQTSEKNSRFASVSKTSLAAWQNREINQLRAQCHKRNKDFYVLPADQVTSTTLMAFLKAVTDGFSCYQQACDLTEQIMRWYPSPCELILADGDKTLLHQDSFRMCAKGFETTVFDGNFYTGYQAFCFEQETRGLFFDEQELMSCTLNDTVVSSLQNREYIILSAGISSLWKKLQAQFSLPHVIASPLISADTKYYIAKLLHAAGYHITAYGDSKNDLYLLREADEGYLYIGDRLSRSLASDSAAGLRLLHKSAPFFLADEKEENVLRDIAICKSDSGINGAPLAQAHYALGIRLGQRIRSVFPNHDTAVLILERGGRFFGDGLYMGFGGQLFPYNPKKDDCPLLNSNLILIVDSVINTGKSILDLIAMLKARNPQAQFCIAANVIQQDALPKLQEYTVFAVRTSANQFVGKRQPRQIGCSGPDTADRLFNLIPDPI